jgi:hypothetical protein
VARERFVRVVSKMEKHVESKSATDITKAWRAFTAQRKYEAIAGGKLLRTGVVSLCRGLVGLLFLDRADNDSSPFLSDASMRQTVIRHNLATNEIHFFKVRVCNTASIVIQSRFRSWLTSKHFRQLVLAVVALQSLVRRHNASKYLLHLKLAQLMKKVGSEEVESVTRIAATWRRFYCQHQYLGSIRGELQQLDLYRRLLTSQLKLTETEFNSSIVNPNAAREKAQELRLESSTRIQAAWRCHIESARFKLILSDVVMIQSLARRLASRRLSQELMEEKCRAESDAATIIQAAWRGHKDSARFKLMISNIVLIQTLARLLMAKRVSRQAPQVDRVILCQSVVRRHLAAGKVVIIRRNRHDAGAQLIQKKWRCFAKKQMVVKMMTDVERRKQKEMSAVTDISKYWRGHRCREDFKQSISGKKMARSFGPRSLISTIQ